MNMSDKSLNALKKNGWEKGLSGRLTYLVDNAGFVLEEIPISTLPSLTVTSVVPSSPHAYHFQVHGDSMPHALGQLQTLTGLKPVTESVAVTTTRAPEMSPAIPSLGLPV